MKFINALWRGKIAPQERCVQSESTYRKLSERLDEERKSFFSTLSEEARAHFEAYERLIDEMQSISEEATFVEGFRMGAQMMEEIFK